MIYVEHQNHHEQQQQHQNFSTSFLVSCNKNMIFMSCVARMLMLVLLIFSILSDYRMHCMPCNFKCKNVKLGTSIKFENSGALTLSIQTVKNENWKRKKKRRIRFSHCTCHFDVRSFVSLLKNFKYSHNKFKTSELIRDLSHIENEIAEEYEYS